ncbi:hypothetical protein BDN72DRAFT_837502 [Pluteus cervinus]|uniref:Uncharacterized protein n=1 Tax=Pluteus cervinus TaxID=181527 RepID=A0ACD3B1E8_9AGAR|nr:hypothetical protein BDN72DRAFT_837502 [Pluteus cervinus]
MGTPTLSVELVDLVLCHLCDSLFPKALSFVLGRCSLVCHVWRDISQRLLLTKFARYGVRNGLAKALTTGKRGSGEKRKISILGSINVHRRLDKQKEQKRRKGKRIWSTQGGWVKAKVAERRRGADGS